MCLCVGLQYARLVARARFEESALQYAAIRDGLSSVIGVVGRSVPHPHPLSLLSWQEVELRVCGQPTLNLEVLKAHTAYAPKQYNKHV
jgi:E3 ubiquitin-protein ligase HECTD3